MKFILDYGVEIEISGELEKHIIVINSESFWYNKNHYHVYPMNFIIDDIYQLLFKLTQDNPNKKIFINRFEKASDTSPLYTVYLAIER